MYHTIDATCLNTYSFYCYPVAPISVPVINYDNNQHGENENVRIGCLWEGIETIVAIMLID